MTKPVEKTIEMKKSIATKWLKALRSGKIKQAEGTLIDADGSMCCLGVLEHICEGEVEQGREMPSFKFLQRNKIKFINGNGRVDTDPNLGNDTASGLNDNGFTFKQIANRLEKRIKYIK